MEEPAERPESCVEGPEPATFMRVRMISLIMRMLKIMINGDYDKNDLILEIRF